MRFISTLIPIRLFYSPLNLHFYHYTTYITIYYHTPRHTRPSDHIINKTYTPYYLLLFCSAI